MTGNLALADCHDDYMKFDRDHSAQLDKAWKNHPEVPNPATREAMAEYDVKKAAFREKMKQETESFKKEFRRRSDECRKLKDAEIQAKKTKS